MLKGCLFYLSFIFFLANCSSQQVIPTIRVSEKNGLDREVEYVSAIIPFVDSKEASTILMAEGIEQNASIPVQVLDTIVTADKKMIRILFPVRIQANQSQSYRIVSGQRNAENQNRIFKLSKDSMWLENEAFKASFSTENDPRGGQVNGIILKDFNSQLLQRGHIAMHWAPNFSKTDSEAYFNFEDIPLASKNELSEGRYQIVKKRSGTTDSVPEIHLGGAYTFYKDLPYFHFESTMLMNSDVELDLLRNDEMTMDSLFTHVVYQTKSGKIDHIELYTEALNVLETSPIPHDAAFVAFYNSKKEYGFGSIRLEYDNKTNAGKPSPVKEPYTKISRSKGNGRYWNRVLSETTLQFPKGSRYHEKNAYIVFRVDKSTPEKEIVYYQQRLMNPLIVVVESNK